MPSLNLNGDPHVWGSYLQFVTDLGKDTAAYEYIQKKINEFGEDGVPPMTEQQLMFTLRQINREQIRQKAGQWSTTRD